MCSASVFSYNVNFTEDLRFLGADLLRKTKSNSLFCFVMFIEEILSSSQAAPGEVKSSLTGCLIDLFSLSIA